MHPALSVILFTVASGAGFGMLALLGLAGLLRPGGLPPALVIAAYLLALALTTFGLFASAFHLGRPERAWRAFSQWRSSWLSREGVLAVATYPAALALAGASLELLPSSATLPAAIATLLLAVATLVSTGMIYASLRAIPRWSNPWTAPGYLVLGAMSGALILHAVLAAALALAGTAGPDLTWIRIWTGAIAGLLLIAGLAVKLAYWWSIDHAEPRASVESAIGLAGHAGPVRLFEPPHTGENYLMQEMGFRIARKHAKKLRRIAVALGFVLPLLLTAAALALPGAAGAALTAALAALFCLIGLLVERWLFFAEARHAVMLYYGAKAV